MARRNMKSLRKLKAKIIAESSKKARARKEEERILEEKKAKAAANGEALALSQTEHEEAERLRKQKEKEEAEELEMLSRARDALSIASLDEETLANMTQDQIMTYLESGPEESYSPKTREEKAEREKRKRRESLAGRKLSAKLLEDALLAEAGEWIQPLRDLIREEDERMKREAYGALLSQEERGIDTEKGLTLESTNRAKAVAEVSTNATRKTTVSFKEDNDDEEEDSTEKQELKKPRLTLSQAAYHSEELKKVEQQLLEKYMKELEELEKEQELEEATEKRAKEIKAEADDDPILEAILKAKDVVEAKKVVQERKLKRNGKSLV